MSHISTRSVWAVLVSLVVAPAVVCGETIEPTGEAALAWRLDSLSSGLLGPDRPAAAFKLSAALLRGAETLVPDQPRFPRLQVLALRQAGDTDKAIDALVRYRKLNPADPVAQIQLVDLYEAREETLDARLKYITETAENQKLQLLPEVRAQLATEAAELLAQKSPALAADMAGKAVQFYPLPRATELYDWYVASRRQLPEQAAGLLAVLKANPVRLEYLINLADLLASNGLSEQSLQWYELVVNVVRDSRIPPPPGFHNLLVDYAAQRAIAGKIQFADSMVGQMLSEQPLDADAWFLKLTIARAQSDEAYKSALDLARTAFIRRWNQMHGEILSGHAATQPAAPEDQRTPDKIQPLDPAPIIEKVQKPGNDAMKAAVVSVTSDIAWFYLYFDHNAEAAGKWIEIVHPLLPGDAVTLRRLEGWQELVANHPSQARDTLSKVAKEDALSELGLITADRLEKKPLDPARVQTLLDANRTGLVGAMLWTAFKSDTDRPKPRPNAGAIEAEVNKFPKTLFSVIDPHSAGRVYTIEAEPLQTTYEYGTPVLARVSIENISDTDLTIGADALIHPDLWFDAEPLGTASSPLPGVAFDQLHGALVLRPHHQVSQTVRLDEGKLRQLLHNSPETAETTVNCDVITNPIPLADRTNGQEVAVPGPAGTAINFYRTFTYTGVPLSLPGGQRTLQAWMTSTSAVQKIHAVDLLAAEIRLARKPGAEDAQKKLAADLPAQLDKLRQDPIPTVSAWASYVAAGLAADSQEAQKIASDMSQSPQWTTRLLSVLAGGARPAELRRQVASRLSNDPAPVVKAAASAMAEWISQMPSQVTDTTRPTTLPDKH
jgi:tetratricopeptide (TPR) repeat protein